MSVSSGDALRRGGGDGGQGGIAASSDEGQWSAAFPLSPLSPLPRSPPKCPALLTPSPSLLTQARGASALCLPPPRYYTRLFPSTGLAPIAMLCSSCGGGQRGMRRGTVPFLIHTLRSLSHAIGLRTRWCRTQNYYTTLLLLCSVCLRTQAPRIRPTPTIYINIDEPYPTIPGQYCCYFLCRASTTGSIRLLEMPALYTVRVDGRQRLAEREAGLGHTTK